jgi:hypothetical protein
MHSGALERLRDDPRIVLSGVSDPRAHLSVAQEFEGYVAPDHLRSLRRDYLLAKGGSGNVILHVADLVQVMGFASGVGVLAPLGLVIADLADHHGPREDAQVRRLIAGVSR